MIGKELKGQKPVSLAEVSEIMEKRKGEGELGFEQQATYDYLKQRKLLPKKKAEELSEELVEKGKVTKETAIKIADILPATESQLAVIVARERHTFGKAELSELLKIVEKYAQ